MFNVGSQLRKIRRRSSLTLDQLAATSGVDRGTISRIELGHVSPRIDTISFLCEAMGTTLSAFFGGLEPAGEAVPAPPVAAAVLPAAAGAAPETSPFLAPPAAKADPDGYWPVPASFWHGLLEVLDRFEMLVKNSRELILVQDRAGSILYASPSCEPLLGLRGSDLVGRPGRALVHPGDLPRVQALQDALLPTANATGRLDCRLRHRDGSWRWVSAVVCNQTANPSILAFVINALETTAPS
jgi:PAS domain S-box-containing protein